METQGQRIKNIRLALKLSQDEFGAIFDISKQYVSLLEKDKTFLNNDKIVKLILDYNVSANYLLVGIGEMFIPKDFEQSHKELALEVRKVLREEGLIK